MGKQCARAGAVMSVDAYGSCSRALYTNNIFTDQEWIIRND